MSNVSPLVHNTHAHNPDCIRIYTFNAQCLRNKFAQLSEFVEHNEPDIVCFSETWFHDGIMDTEFTPAGYICFRKDRKLSYYAKGTYKEEERGGVCTLVKSSLNPILLTEGDVDVEICWIKVHPNNNSTLTIGNCYRHESDEINVL